MVPSLFICGQTVFFRKNDIDIGSWLSQQGNKLVGSPNYCYDEHKKLLFMKLKKK